MMNGYPCENVPLYHTINALPYWNHLSDRKCSSVKILGLGQQRKGIYCVTYGDDGSLNLWNTELALFRVFRGNFRDEFQRHQQDTNFVGIHEAPKTPSLDVQRSSSSATEPIPKQVSPK